jgi:hypothetical protein
VSDGIPRDWYGDTRQPFRRVDPSAGYGCTASGEGATEFNVMMAQIDNTISVIMANFPKDAQGRLLFLTFTADNSGRNTSITFAAAQVAPVKTALDALIATIRA